MEKRWQNIAWGMGLLVLSVAVVLGLSSLVLKFPEYYPEHTLELEDRTIGFFERITLPIKLTHLTLRDPDVFVAMPVYGIRVAQVADTWHEPRSDNRLHEGQDIFASRGTPIFSATRGYVIRISTGELGGNSVYVRGAGRRTYFYTHLDRFPDELSVGQWVGTDTVLGFVGNSGNAETTPTHLHFGIYALGKAIDPLPLLVDRP